MNTEVTSVNAGSVEHVIDVAIAEFSDHGYAETKLDTVSKLSGMSKRMIHYHFGDKKGLYQQALATAAKRLNPPEGSLAVDSAVPVEGVRTLVDWMFRQHVEHPEAIKMMTMESSHSVLAFLTANIPDIGFESYLSQNETELEAESAPLDVYSTEDEGGASTSLYG